jgi:hypothetical protein
MTQWVTKSLMAVLSFLAVCCEQQHKSDESLRLDVRKITEGATRVALDDMMIGKVSCEEWAQTKRPALDPWRHPYRYRCTAKDVCVSSDGNDRIPRTPDDIEHCVALPEHAL